VSLLGTQEGRAEAVLEVRAITRRHHQWWFISGDLADGEEL